MFDPTGPFCWLNAVFRPETPEELRDRKRREWNWWLWFVAVAGVVWFAVLGLAVYGLVCLFK